MAKKTTEIHPVDAHAGEMLRRARKLRGLSQDTLGKELPETVTFQQIQKYERGKNRMSISRMYEFIKVLQVPRDYFLPAENDQALPLVNNREALLLDNFRALPIRTQDTIMALIATLVGG